jgi:alcohol dehydrogenase class IV
MDLGKAATAIAVNSLSAGTLFTTPFDKALPVAAVPTTADTGSAVTQYALLTSDAVQSKTSLSSLLLFPRIAFLDVRYLLSLGRNTTVNTALDALSHAVEGMLGGRASAFTDAAAKSGIRAFAECLPALPLNSPHTIPPPPQKKKRPAYITQFPASYRPHRLA